MVGLNFNMKTSIRFSFVALSGYFAVAAAVHGPLGTQPYAPNTYRPVAGRS